MDNPKYSIITIAWNNLAGLRKTSASVSEQSLRDFEWIVIDGASTDGTAELAKSEFSQADIFISEHDNGLYDAMNKGLSRASGEYVIFMNGGDTFADEHVLQLISDTPEFGASDLIYGDAFEVDGQHRVYKPAMSHRTVPYTMFAHHQSMFYRREALQGLHYDLSYTIAADWVLTAQLLRRGGKAAYIPKPICRFERDGLSQSTDRKVIRKIREERVRAQREVFHLNPLVSRALLLIKGSVESFRRRFPSLYDRLRMRKA